jgi:arylsulfatase A-like enzyme
VLAAIAARPTFAEEDWLIAVTADHGGWERSHGQSSTACYTIPLLFAGRHVAQGRMPGVPRNYDIAPTVLTHFGVDISGIDFDGRVRGNDAPVTWPSRPLSDGLAVSLAFNGDAANKGASDVTAELRGAAVLIPDGVSGGALRVSPSADAAGSAF